MKKKTPTQMYIDHAVAAAKEELAGTHISNCNVDMNVNFGEAVSLIAEGLVENAKALGDLAKTVKHQNINAFYIESK